MRRLAASEDTVCEARNAFSGGNTGLGIFKLVTQDEVRSQNLG